MDSSTAIAEQLEDRKEEVSEGKPQPQRDDVITPTTGTAEKLRTPTDVLVGGLAQPERGQDDPRAYYTTFYNQSTSVILIATFTGGVQATVLAFMNDLLSGSSLRVAMFPPHPFEPNRTIYSAYSLGLMVGLLPIALNLAVAAIASVNAALSCHFTIHTPKYKPSMEARITLCMIIQFVASGLAGISLVLLCFKFDLAFAIITAVLFFAGILISAYHLIALFGSQWFTDLRGQPLHSISIFISLAAFVAELTCPAPSSWFTISAFGITITYHLLAVLHNRPTNGDRPRRLAFFGVVFVSFCWGSCVAVTWVIRRSYRLRDGRWEEVLRFVVAILAGVEAGIVAAIAACDGWAIAKWNKWHPTSPIFSRRKLLPDFNTSSVTTTPMAQGNATTA